MIVTSVASGSFQAQVWGVTYTVNWTGNVWGREFPEFYFRNGNSGGIVNPTQQIQVGDEVSVSGLVSGSAPLVVDANVVRDWSIMAARPFSSSNSENTSSGENSSVFPGIGNGQGNGRGNENGFGIGAQATGSVNFATRLSEIMDQIKNLKNLMHGRFGR